jgi:hypothetical protein
MCAFRDANFTALASLPTDRDGGPDPAGQVHEFMLLRFAPGIDPGPQQLVMEALGHHLSGCEGLIARELFRGQDGEWVEHVTRASQADLDASEGTTEDAVHAALFDCFDTSSVSYLRAERVEPAGLGATGEPDGANTL